jgi:hypothetical protein
MVKAVCHNCDEPFEKHIGSSCEHCSECNSITVERNCLMCRTYIRVGYFSKKKYKKYFCNYCIKKNNNDILDNLIEKKDVIPLKYEIIFKQDFTCKKCKLKVCNTSYIYYNKKYCDKCYQLESDIRLHNSIIAVAHLYLRNEDWLNEVVYQGFCSYCHQKMYHKRRIINDVCMYCCQDIKAVHNGTIEKNKIYKNVYLKITFCQTQKYGNRDICDRYVYKYPLLKTIKQSHINFYNKINNLNLLKYYQHPEYPHAKVESAKVKYKVRLG